MARGKKKTIEIKLIIGILFLLVLLIGASYAYFAVEVNSTDYNKTVITGSTEGVAIASIQNPTTKLNLNVDSATMIQKNLGTIYADDEANYVKTKSEGFHDIGVITLTSPKKDDNIYRCTANVTITINNGSNSILNTLQEGDLKIFLRWGINHEVIDLSTIKDTGKTTIPISLDIVGNNSKSIETYIELTNKDEDQSYLSGKDINIDIDTTDLKCELTGERAVYIKTGGGSLGYLMNHTTDIKNIYFVDYIDTENAVEEPIDLTSVGTGNNQSPAESIMGWLEEIPKEENEEQYYDLYIGSKDKIYAKNLNNTFRDMNHIENIDFGNFYTDLATSMYDMFWGVSSIIELDLSKFDTSNVTNMARMFNSAKSIVKLDVSNFNTKNVTTMSSMFNNLNSVREIDVSNFNTMKVTGMDSMFASMSALAKLDVSGFYTSNVTIMSGMFRGLSQLNELNVSKFDTSRLTSMDFMFLNMESLSLLDVSSFDTSQVTSMHTMFGWDSSLQKLDLSNFNTSSVLVTFQMLRDLNVKYIDLRNAEFSQVTSFYQMFLGVENGLTIIVKDEANREWIEERLKEVNVIGTVLLPNEIQES